MQVFELILTTKEIPKSQGRQEGAKERGLTLLFSLWRRILENLFCITVWPTEPKLRSGGEYV